MSDTRDVPDDARVEELAQFFDRISNQSWPETPALQDTAAALRELLTLRAKLARIRREGAWPEPSIAGGKSPLRATVEPAGFAKTDTVWAGEHAKPWDGKMDPERTTYWSEVGNDYRDVRWLPGLIRLLTEYGASAFAHGMLDQAGETGRRLQEARERSIAAEKAILCHVLGREEGTDGSE